MVKFLAIVFVTWFFSGWLLTLTIGLSGALLITLRKAHWEGQLGPALVASLFTAGLYLPFLWTWLAYELITTDQIPPFDKVTIACTFLAMLGYTFWNTRKKAPSKK